MTNDIEKTKAYAARLEEIIQAIPMEAGHRILVNHLVGDAKKEFEMCNN